MGQNVCQEEVYKSIFYTHSEHIRNFLYYKSGNLALAEDLVQDAFGKLWENCAKVEFPKVKSYLFTIANNLFLNHVNHQKVVLKFDHSDVSLIASDRHSISNIWNAPAIDNYADKLFFWLFCIFCGNNI